MLNHAAPGTLPGLNGARGAVLSVNAGMLISLVVLAVILSACRPLPPLCRPYRARWGTSVPLRVPRGATGACAGFFSIVGRFSIFSDFSGLTFCLTCVYIPLARGRYLLEIMGGHFMHRAFFIAQCGAFLPGKACWGILRDFSFPLPLFPRYRGLFPISCVLSFCASILYRSRCMASSCRDI